MSDEAGQVLILAALAMVMLLVVVALVDIGKAYLIQRQLQAGVDAALAGAQHLPEPSAATLSRRSTARRSARRTKSSPART